MNDLVAKLRDKAQFFRGGCEWPATADAFAEAADEVERLRAALTKIELLVGMSEKLDAIHDEIRAALGEAKE